MMTIMMTTTINTCENDGAYIIIDEWNDDIGNDSHGDSYISSDTDFSDSSESDSSESDIGSDKKTEMVQKSNAIDDIWNAITVLTEALATLEIKFDLVHERSSTSLWTPTKPLNTSCSSTSTDSIEAPIPSPLTLSPQDEQHSSLEEETPLPINCPTPHPPTTSRPPNTF